MQRTQPKQNTSNNELELNDRISALWGLINNGPMRTGQQKQVHLRMLPAQSFDAISLQTGKQTCLFHPLITVQFWEKKNILTTNGNLPGVYKEAWFSPSFFKAGILPHRQLLCSFLSPWGFMWGSDLETKQNNVICGKGKLMWLSYETNPWEASQDFGLTFYIHSKWMVKLLNKEPELFTAYSLSGGKRCQK